jgi:hypothetical protein
MKLFFLALLLIPALNAQELQIGKLDSLYFKFLQLTAPELLPQTMQSQELKPADRKCGFVLVNQVQFQFERFSSEQKLILKSLLQRPIKQATMVSPFGFFRIHYDYTGSDTPGYDNSLSVDENVMQVAFALDSSFNFEVNYLGFSAPPSDNGAGGDDLYDVYIDNQGGGLYGYTEWENNIGPVNWTSFMVIDNDYTAYYSTGLNGMKVTVAHEFHHGIQVGNYSVENGSSPFRDDDIFFYELTSTSMEEFVYDDVNDYYAYIPDYFNHPYRSLKNQNGYNLAHWNIFLQQLFGFEIIKEQWELIPTQSAAAVINSTLFFRSTSFSREYNRFAVWSYFTGYRAVPGLYFGEAQYYPLVTPLVKISYPQFTFAEVDAEPASNNYVRFAVTTTGDTLYAVVTNGDVEALLNTPFASFTFKYTLFNDGTSGIRKLTENYSADFDGADNSVWSVSEILNDVIVLEDTVKHPAPGEINYAYPNPFNYNSYFLSVPLIFFPFDAGIGEDADFNVYTSGMRLVYSSEKTIQNLPGSKRGISWDGLDNEKQKLGSGVYIYVIKRGDEIVKGKVVIFNE